MSLGNVIKTVVSNRELRFALMTPLKVIPDEPYLKLAYKVATGKDLNLENPTGINEKLQWLKLHAKNPAYAALVDKIEARKIVNEKIGPGHTLPILKVWDSFGDVVFDELPQSFVLKCNHDSGSVKIIKDKSKLDAAQIVELNKFYSHRLKGGKDYIGREYPYDGVTPKLLAEPYIETVNGDFPDYKIFCFAGEPKLLLIVTDRYGANKHEDYFDMEGNHIKMTCGCTYSEVPPELPVSFEEMKEYAATLSQGIPVVRMDFYEIDGVPYFGEYTFFSAGGFELFQPEEWEQRLGSWITLPSEVIK